MSLFPFYSTAVRRLCRKTIVAGYFTRRRVRDVATHISSLDPDHSSFEAAGIQPAIAALLRIAFPNVQKPTAMQRKLIRAMTSSRDVLLQDDTGTGKSFAAMLALLSKDPAGNVHGETGGSPSKVLTGLLIVPHRDLAYQYLHWIHHMTLPEDDAPLSLTKYAQVFVRHVDRSTLQRLPLRMQEAIRSASSDRDLSMHERPRILIATPNTLLELMEQQCDVFRLAEPSVVVVDEADAFLRIPSSRLPNERRRARQKRLEKHTPDLVRVLNRLYPTSGDMQRTHRRSHPARNESLGQGTAAPVYRPQLIMISATLRRRFQNALFDTYGWVKRGEVMRLIKKGSSALPAHRLGRSAVHHVLVVSKTGDIKNIDGARPREPDVSPLESGATGQDEDGIFYDEDGDDPELVGDTDKELLRTPLAFDPGMLEAVAATFALDVPQIGLLVVPATAAVRKIIFELRQLGVNAHPFDLTGDGASRAHALSRMEEDSDENPTLIVATLATVRGIDLPDLSHVFILGVPEGRAGDAYVHVAGRVGRFGRRGKVVTVLEESGGGARKMGVLLSRLGVKASRLEHFD